MISAPAATRICIIAEELNGPADEGGRNFARNLATALAEIADVRAISVGGDGEALAGKTFLDRELKDELRAWQPSLVIYLPSASLTLFSVLRSRVLRAWAPGARVAMVVHQPRNHSLPARLILRSSAPDVIFSQDGRLVAYAEQLGCRAELLPPAIDIERFCPVDIMARVRLRRHHGFAADAFVVLHVGHLKQERNLGVLGRLAEFASVAMVGAESTGVDADVLDELESSGVRVIRGQVQRIEELYQLADCYVFPVRSDDGAISMPLSVLEAMAADLPVVTTPFGALPDTFPACDGLRYAADDEAIVAAVSDRGWMAGGTRQLVYGYSWRGLAERLLERAVA